MKNNYVSFYHSTDGCIAEYNTIIKTYVGSRFKLSYKDFSCYKGFCYSNKHNGSSSLEQLERYKNRRLFLRREKIQDLAYNYNNWQFFLTLTFDDNVVDGFDYDLVFKKLSQWLKYQKKSNKDMVYLIVPELHKSGRIHFHGLFSNVPNWILEPSINPKNGNYIFKNNCQIFNLVNYRLGFSTVSHIKNINAVSFYISKYMTKELLNIRNRKNIWHSRNLVLPKKSYLLFNDIYELIDYTKTFNVTHNNYSSKNNIFRYYANLEINDDFHPFDDL